MLEGTDGSGKATQTAMLNELLERWLGQETRRISFPRYGNPMAGPVEQYLQGRYGTDPSNVNPYAASLFYAIDRFDSYATEWGSFYDSGGIIVADRYTTSNAVHQGAKLDGTARWDYLNWLY